MSAIDWDAIEKKAMKNPVYLSRQHIRTKKAVTQWPDLPALPLHLSSTHLKEFVDVRCHDLGVRSQDLFAQHGMKDKISLEIRRQIMFEAFILGFPSDYIIKHFMCNYGHLSYAIADYCGDIRIQKVRERYGISVYSRQVFRV